MPDPDPFKGDIVLYQNFKHVLKAVNGLCLQTLANSLEVTAALEGLKAVLASTQATFTHKLYILLDNLEVARQLQGSPTCSSQETFQAFKELAES